MPRLYIVPTPIGNLSDFTFRAVEVLKKADFILAEDTRTSSVLLKHYEISRPLLAYHMHNEHKILKQVTDRIKACETAALISDAGTPGISDPGYMLIRECLKNNIDIESLPGPSAFIPALLNSGLPCDRFLFEGFLPHKKGRQKRMESLANQENTIILYESPHRLLKCLQQLSEHMGMERKASVSREITKIHEETIRGSLEELINHFSEKNIKGEIVIIIEGK